VDERLNNEFRDALNSSLIEHQSVILRLRSVSQNQTVRARARALALQIEESILYKIEARAVIEDTLAELFGIADRYPNSVHKTLRRSAFKLRKANSVRPEWLEMNQTEAEDAV
tara:strand:- start:5 stop:343 length:339 start_codon:yes stop_codon:yes gene_type:complete